MKLYYETSDTLMHHGIKGMKWGRRRFQNSDDRLTAAGRKRYATIGEAVNNARKAGRDAVKSLNASPEKHTASQYRRTSRSAIKESIANDKSYNKQLKEERKAERNTPEAKAARKEKAIKAAKVGAAVAGTALAAYGAYKLNEYAKTESGQKNIKAAKEWLDDTRSETETKFYDKKREARQAKDILLYGHAGGKSYAEQYGTKGLLKRK